MRMETVYEEEDEKDGGVRRMEDGGARWRYEEEVGEEVQGGGII